VTEASEPVAETTAETAAQEDGTEHFLMAIDDNIRIDAEVTIPEKQAYSTYTLKQVDSDPERLFGIFSPEGHGNYTVRDSGYYKAYEENTGKKLTVYYGADYCRLLYNGKGLEGLDDFSTLMYYYTQEHSQVQPHDLSFMTVEEMETSCQELMNQIGIGLEPSLTQCATLTSQELLDFQEELFGSNGLYVEAGFQPTTLTEAEAEEVCYLTYSFTCDGLALLGENEPGVSSAFDMSPPSAATATFLITADGLQICNVVYPCTVEPASEPQTILTLGEAANLLAEKYDLVINTEPLVFSRVWLEYIPRVTEGTVTMAPYWCFTEWKSVQIVGDITTMSGVAERFNAITGQDLTYEE